MYYVSSLFSRHGVVLLLRICEIKYLHNYMVQHRSVVLFFIVNPVSHKKAKGLLTVDVIYIIILCKPTFCTKNVQKKTPIPVDVVFILR